MSTFSHKDIAELLKQDILRGLVAPGDRLPSRVELERRFDTTPVTLNRAMKRLVEEGFIHARVGSGTRVSLHPPHLSQFALAFPFKHVAGLSRFYEALRDEAARLQSDDRRVSAFYDIESHVDVEDYQRLLGFVRAHRLAGLIFAGNPYVLMEVGSPLVREPGVPRVAIMMSDVSVTYPTVYPDIDAFLPKAFDHLASRGRKRAAVVVLGGSTHADPVAVQAMARARGLTVRPYWIQAGFAGAADWARQTALLLLHPQQNERPDAVVITDDNLVEGVTVGIRDSGIRVAEPGAPAGSGELDVVAQTNFPHPTPSAVPVKRLGYDIRRLMAICLERIEQQRRGETPPAHTPIPAVWEEAVGSGGR